MSKVTEEMDIRWIRKILPHRQPFLLIDRVLELTPNSAVAVKSVSFNEPFFAGHFPEFPVMPGVLIVEAMAQTSAIVANTSEHVEQRDSSIALFAGMDNVRFRRPVVPGDQMRIEIEINYFRRSYSKGEGRVLVDGELVCSGTLMSVIKDVDSDS